jgi:uncharacterized protein YjbI with pentapeptide repeats
MTDDGAPNRAAELRASVDDAAKSVSAIYITFVLAGIYIAIAIGSTTDMQLLAESDIALPLLNVGLPVRAFYMIVPFGFLLFHLYILLHIYLLSVKLAEFEANLRTLPTERERQYQRRLLFPFTISPVSIRASNAPAIIKGVLWLIVSTTVLAAPPALLAFALLRFVPYHSLAITWWHRALLFGDVTMLWVLWIFILRCSPIDPDGFWQHLATTLRRSGLAAGAMAIAALAFIVAVTIPDEPLDQATVRLDNLRHHLHRNLAVKGTPVVREAPSPQLVAAYIEQGRTKDDAWREHAKGIDLRERDLRGADFSHSSFYGADMRGANLDLAMLEGANFQGADFGPLKRDDGTTVVTMLRGADLASIDLRFTSLHQADLRGADLSNAHMDGANLLSANLSGVKQSRLIEEVRGVFGLNMRGAILFAAHLEEADLRWADLRGADLNVAHLQRATLHGANLTGAAFGRTDLRGADLHSAILELCEFQQTETGTLSADEEKAIREDNARVPKRKSAKPPAEPLKPVAGLDDSPKLPSSFYDAAFATFARLAQVSLKEDEYIGRAVTFLSELACKDAALARGVAYRASMHLVFEANFPELSLEQHQLSRKLAAELLRAEVDHGCKGIKFLGPAYRDGLEQLSRGLRPALKPADPKR